MKHNSLRNRFSWHWLLVGVVFIAFLLRVIGNTHTPPSLYWEEVALGYDAYSVLQTGADHQGNAWPIVAFPSFGDFKPSGYFYALVPSVAIFGLNAFAVRLPAVLASTAITLFVFLWARDLAQPSKKAVTIGLASALVWAIQPWGWWLGRVGFEVNLATFLLISGTYLLWRGTTHLKQKNALLLFLATILLAGSMYTYHGTRLLAPLFAGFIALWQLAQLPKNKRFSRLNIGTWLGLALLAGALVAPILIASQSPAVQQRIAETSIFTDLSPIEDSNTYRALANNTWWARILYHRSVFWAAELFKNYSSHFSASFLFTAGDTNPRHSSQYLGLLYPWELITLLCGLVAVWVTSRSRFWLLIGLILLSPIPAMFTFATPHALRAFPLAIWLAILSGWGGVVSFSWLKQQLGPLAKRLQINSFTSPALILVYSLAVFMSTFALGFYYWQVYPTRYSHEWQYGYEEMIAKMRHHQQPGEKLYVSRAYGRPSMYVLFYEKVDPQKVQSASPTLPKDQRELLQFEEWSFYNGQKHETGLHASPRDEVPENATIIEEISNLADDPIWTIYR